LPRYDDGKVWIEVVGTKFGVATIWDKEILIYCASLIAEKLNRGETPSARLWFRPNDFFTAVGTSNGGQAYLRFDEAMKRLKSTFIRTNIVTGGESIERGFGWLDEYKTVSREENGRRVVHGVEVVLCEWLMRAILKDKNFLTYPPSYFSLSPLGKRLYEIGRSQTLPVYYVHLEKLHERVGTDQDLRRFKSELTAYTTGKRQIPGFNIKLLDPQQVRMLDPDEPKRHGTTLKAWKVAFMRTEDGSSAKMITATRGVASDAAEADEVEIVTVSLKPKPSARRAARKQVVRAAA
jgi:hypothetical protein